MKSKLKKCILMGASLFIIGIHNVQGDAESVDNSTTLIGVGFGEVADLGSLAIEWSPSELDFGKENNPLEKEFAEISGNNKYVVVNDDRVLANNWQLTLQLSYMQSESKTHAMASLMFESAIRGYQGDSNPEEDESAIIESDGQTANLESSSFILHSGSPAIPLLTEEGDFKGKTVLEMSNVKINMYSVIMSETQYEGMLTWSLEDTV